MISNKLKLKDDSLIQSYYLTMMYIKYSHISTDCEDSQQPN